MNKKRTLLLSIAFVLAFFGTFTIPFALAAPTISTGSAYNITDTSATLQATFNVDTEDEVEVFFQIGSSSTSAVEYDSSGTHTQTVTGLTPNTEYQYRAVLQYTSGWWFWTRTYTVYGDYVSFTTTGDTPPPPPPPPPPPQGKNPILFVHGLTGAASNWNTMKGWFEDNGYDRGLLFAFTFNNPDSSSSGQNEENAEEIDDWIDDILAQTGASEVDIIGHSMGGLSSRWYIKFMGGTSKVDDYVSLGTPQHGTTLSWWGDMRRGSRFLTELNSGDETPAGVDWTTVRTADDELVQPIDTAMLDGADNYLIDNNVGHIDLLTDSETFNIAYAAVID